MSTVEVLAPLRLETRFVPPSQRTDGVNQWMLRLRVYPDEFSIRRRVAPPTPEELDRLEESVARLTATPPWKEADAFASFAASVGAARALRLWRDRVAADGAGGFTVDRTGAAPLDPFDVHDPAGLPETLEVWFVHTNGTRTLATTLSLDVVEIGNDLDIKTVFEDLADRNGVLPDTWWLSHSRAKDLGLAIDLDIGVTPPSLTALVVVGIGDTDAAELVDAHNANGRMAVLAPGTPTNTIAGEPTTDFGERAESLSPLLHVDPATQMSSAVVLKGLTGRVAADALPMAGGDLDYYGPGSLAVQGLWPVLWGRMLRDVIGAGANETALARWAIRNLSVEGPRPAFRVGEQPYGLLPTSTFGTWVASPNDDLADVEARIREWALPWRAGAAAAALAARGRVHGADIPDLLDVVGVHAPTRYWNVRAVADLYQLQALRTMFGMAPLDTAWDNNTAHTLRGDAKPIAPIGRAPGEAAIPGPPRDDKEDIGLLRSLPMLGPEPLLYLQRQALGLVGHLMREALIDARAVVGDAAVRLQAGTPIAIGQRLSWTDENAYRSVLFQGTDLAVTALRAGADPNGRLVADRFKEIQEAIQVIADLWEPLSKPLFRAALAALDTAAFRVDPWLTGIAERRLQQMIASGAPFRLGAYGWVDGPAPYNAAPGGPLAPGPTAAGLLHAPSSAQALTAAILRDAAVRYPGDNRWKLQLDSAKIRAAIALAERVRLGLHPYEALGLEVERIAGDWDVVRVLRKTYPLATDQQERRVCDGQKVLEAARTGALALVPDLPADLATRLEPLDSVLDTYGDLLVTDGVHALVSGRADLANAAMEAAAGLGAPPGLRAVHTPREATTVRVSAWALLAAAESPASPNASPGRVADPAFAAIVDAELGAGIFNGDDDAEIEQRRRLAAVVGGADEHAPVPSLTGGGYEGVPLSADADLRRAIATDLRNRLTEVVTLAQEAHDALALVDPNDGATAAIVKAAARRWTIDLKRLVAEDPAIAAPTTAEKLAHVVDTLSDRLAAAAALPPGTGGLPPTDDSINLLKRAIRDVVGRADLPVLPMVSRSLLPTLRPRATLDRDWLEIVAAVRPRLTPLEARQLDPTQASWAGAVAAPRASSDPWQPSGAVVVAYGPGVDGDEATVAIAAVDGWTDSVPSRRHTTFAAFGFNAPKSRAPQAVLLAVPPDVTKRLDNAALLDVVLDTRELAHARAPRQPVEPTLAHPTSTAFVSAVAPRNFLEGWPA
ncbi:hypothetical protein QTH97_33495 [Variovorax sp. J22R24]|uniref:hypothetical protein n=1 Tax=Variovorax gracilis TaxID=3053502 RepID=UPI002576CACD|nr:hypothetical protein [Variovorax sp. J22R24]MDM0109869.1 hypothetical protein [Variovorax sp. J22R24]